MISKIFTPTVTIQKDNGKIDIEGNIKLMNALADAGIDGVVPLGSTGEFPFFKDNKEKKQYLNEYIQAAKGRMELLVGTGGIGYEETIDLSNYVLSRGVKGVLVISEFYFNMSQDDFYKYYSFMAENIDGDVYIYNFPARTGSSIEADTIAALALRYKNIKGMKDSILDFGHTEKILRQVLKVRPDFEVFSGYDHQFLDNHKLGGAGGVGALSNVVPKIWADWVKATAKGDVKGMEAGKKRIEELMPFYSLESNPQKLIKEVLRKE
ncbi:MAG: dihydrodipicolinate synthase family protein, partial [Tyzzerella sp.]|nr:dihydrodipicolinate synthase family protein [Tyzzerella sp.]